MTDLTYILPRKNASQKNRNIEPFVVTILNLYGYPLAVDPFGDLDLPHLLFPVEIIQISEKLVKIAYVSRRNEFSVGSSLDYGLLSSG